MRVDINETNNEAVKKDKKADKTSGEQPKPAKKESKKSPAASETKELTTTSDDKATKDTKDTKAASKKTTKSTDDQPKEAKQPKSASTKAKESQPAAAKTKKVKTIKVDILDDDDKTKKAKPSEMKLPTVRKIHVRVGYLVLATLLILIGAFFTKVALWEHNYLLAKEGSERMAPISNGTPLYETTEGEEVDEEEPSESEIQAYTVAPDKPRYLNIPSLRIHNTRIREIGVNNRGELATPASIFDIGWYTGSALPGERGTSVMDAHGGTQGVGIFKDLPRLKVGDIITIEMGDGRMFDYRVVDVVTKGIGDDANNYMSTAFSTPDGSNSSLTLITCTGDWSDRLRTYSQRLFVRAVLVQ